MKRIIAFLLSIALLLSGCSQTNPTMETNSTTSTNDQTVSNDIVWVDTVPEYGTLDNPELLYHIEDLVYKETVSALNNERYLVENVKAVYISKEYLDEISFNSQENIYFGHTLSELDALFQGSRYIFTLGSDGQTDVQELQEIRDTTSEEIIKDVAIGVGVILVCVTVSAVTAGAGAPAVSLIFAASAKTATTMALSSAAFGGISAGVVKGIETGDMSQALKAAAVASAEGFKWGAISGAISGGVTETVKYAKALKALKGAELKGLTTQQAAAIQMESGYPVDVIKQFHTVEEYNVFKQAGLRAEMLNGNTSLVRSDIDLYNIVDEYGRNNYTRLSNGLNPIDSTGKTYQWHHIGQENDATLALLTATEHDAGSLHGFKVVSEIDRVAFDTYKKALNKDLLNWLLTHTG